MKAIFLSLLLVLILVTTFHVAKHENGNVTHALVVTTVLAMILAFCTGLNVGMAEHAGFTESVVALIAMLSTTALCFTTIQYIKDVFGICFLILVGVACLVQAIRSLLPEILGAQR